MLNVDGDGFLLNRNDWNEDVMKELITKDGLELTDEIKALVVTLREEFESTGTVLPLRNFSKLTGGDRKGTHLNKIFNGGPMKVLARISGLPKPTGCV